MITCTTFWWHDPEGRRNAQYTYTAAQVNRVADQIDANMTLPHEHVCVTDMEPAALRPDIRIVPMDRSLLAPGTRFPKMQMFAPGAEAIGQRIFYVDLDTLIVGNIDHLVNRDDDIVLWANPRWGKPRATRINTSVMLIRAGSRPQVWSSFDLGEGVKRAWPKMAGTDQVYISECLADEAKWDHRDGIYWCREFAGSLPDNACIVTFAGKLHPDQKQTQRDRPWILEYA